MQTQVDESGIRHGPHDMASRPATKGRMLCITVGAQRRGGLLLQTAAHPAFIAVGRMLYAASTVPPARDQSNAADTRNACHVPTERRPGRGQRRSHHDAARLAARGARPDRHQGRLQRRRLRRLLCHGDRRARHPRAECLHPVYGPAQWSGDPHGGRHRRPRWDAAPGSGRDGRTSRQPVRLLHAGVYHHNGRRASERGHGSR